MPCCRCEPFPPQGTTPAPAGGRTRPGPGRGRLRIDGVCVSNVGPIGKIHFGVGCDLLIQCIPRCLQTVRVSRSGSGLPPVTGPGPHGPQPGGSESSEPESLCPCQARLESPARTGTGRVARLSRHPSHRTPCRERRSGLVCRLHLPQPVRRRGCPARGGPAGRPEHHRRRVCGRNIEATEITRGE